MSQPIISVEGLGKRYLVGHQSERERYTALRDVIARNVKNLARTTRDLLRGKQVVQGDEVEEFWALKDVSFEVQPGEVVGIIGRNGAGKSTLLKILSRITEPTEGRVTIRGRVASLLEVGTGFHPELTGRENIYLNGAILGMTRVEIKKKFDEIVAFAEVEKFLDTPVKRYSSGMYVRLAFAVAAHLEPEILVVDEVLAVGDAEFQKKCLGKMQDVAADGRTVLFVSHQMAAIQNLCSRGIVLSNGKVFYTGKISLAIQQYTKSLHAPLLSNDLQHIRRAGSGAIRFSSFNITDLDGNPIKIIPSGSDVRLVFGIQNLSQEVQNRVNIGFGVHGSLGERLFVIYSSHLNTTYEVSEEGCKIYCILYRVPLNPGRYPVFPRLEIGGVEADFPQEPVGALEVGEGDFYGTGRVLTDKGLAPFLVDGNWIVEEAV